MLTDLHDLNLHSLLEQVASIHIVFANFLDDYFISCQFVNSLIDNSIGTLGNLKLEFVVIVNTPESESFLQSLGELVLFLFSFQVDSSSQVVWEHNLYGPAALSLVLQDRIKRQDCMKGAHKSMHKVVLLIFLCLEEVEVVVGKDHPELLESLGLRSQVTIPFEQNIIIFID